MTPTVDGREPTATDDSVSIRWDDFRALWKRSGVARRRARRTRTDMAAAALWLGALFSVFVTWNGAADKTSVGEQVPYLLSGGLATVSFALGGSVVFLLGVLGNARAAGDDIEAAATTGEER